VNQKIEQAKQLLAGILQWAKEKVDQLRRWVQQKLHDIGVWLRQKWEELKVWLKSALDAVVAFLRRALDWVLKALLWLVKALASIVLGALWLLTFIWYLPPLTLFGFFFGPAVRALIHAALDAMWSDPIETDTGPCDVSLGFLPLHAAVKKGVPKEMAYIAAVHTFIEWNGHSAGFTADKDASGNDEAIADARVYKPEPRLATDGGDVRRVKAQWDPAKKGQPGYPSTCAEVYAKLDTIVVPNSLRGQYSLFSRNCETFAREMLADVGMIAGSAPDGGYGNDFIRYMQADPVFGLRRWAKDHGLGILPAGI
jgi:hypothetical protein